jgi:hypothetical protein
MPRHALTSPALPRRARNREGKLDALEEINSQLRHVLELCDSRIEGASRDDKVRAAEKTEALLAAMTGKDALGVISRRPDSDLQKAAEVLTELETLEYGSATQRHLDDIFSLLVILDPGSEAAALALQARIRGNKLRKDLEVTGGDLAEAHRKQQQYLVLKEQIVVFEEKKKKLLHQNAAIFSHPIFTRNTYCPGIDISSDEVFKLCVSRVAPPYCFLSYSGRTAFSPVSRVHAYARVRAHGARQADTPRVHAHAHACRHAASTRCTLLTEHHR